MNLSHSTHITLLSCFLSQQLSLNGVKVNMAVETPF